MGILREFDREKIDSSRVAIGVQAPRMILINYTATSRSSSIFLVPPLPHEWK